MKKLTDILASVPPDLRTEVQHCANQFGAVRAVFGRISTRRTPDLLEHADTHALRWRWRVIRFDKLNDELRLLNIAEKLVVATRIESAAKTTRASRSRTSPTRR